MFVHWETLLNCFVFSSEPGTELTCCVQSHWPLKDKCWVCWVAPTSSGLKEFSDCYISKTYSWKRATSFKAASEISGNPFPRFHLFFSRAEDGVYFSEVWGKKKKEQIQLCLRKSKLLTCNLRVVQSFTIKPRQCPRNTDMVVYEKRASSGCIHLCICWYYVALKSLESPRTFISFWCVWISACLLQHSCCMKRSRLGCFISCLSLLQLN